VLKNEAGIHRRRIRDHLKPQRHFSGKGAHRVLASNDPIKKKSPAVASGALPGAGTDKISARHEYEDGEGARPRCAAGAPRPRRRGDRMRPAL